MTKTNYEFTVAVKSFAAARRIAKAMRGTNPEAAAIYLAKFEQRQSIETAARANVEKMA